jgi:hypothetical protein
MPRFFIGLAMLATLVYPSRAEQAKVWQATLEAWLAAVDAHVPGRVDAAATTVARWVNGDFSLMGRYIDGLLEMLPPAPRNARVPRGVNDEDLRFLRGVAKRVRETTDRNELIKRAAMLHADVMIFGLAKEAHYSTPDGARHASGEPRRIVILSKDGEPQGFAVTPAHWDFARHLLTALLPSASDDPFVPQWYNATTAHMFLNLRWDESEDHLEFARRTIGADARLEFDTGCLHERLASPTVTIVLDAVQRSPAPIGPVASRPDSLSKAEAAFKEAIRLDPEFLEARVRLGRVMTLRGRSEEALEFLRPVVEEGRAGSIVGYFAALFLGDVHERAGRHDAALAAYRQASTLYPEAQSPRLALSALAIARGDHAGGIVALQHLLGLPPDEQRRHDPWWLYYIGVGRHRDSLMEALWASVPKAAAR